MINIVLGIQDFANDTIVNFSYGDDNLVVNYLVLRQLYEALGKNKLLTIKYLRSLVMNDDGSVLCSLRLAKDIVEWMIAREYPYDKQVNS